MESDILPLFAYNGWKRWLSLGEISAETQAEPRAITKALRSLYHAGHIEHETRLDGSRMWTITDAGARRLFEIRNGIGEAA